jgi:hypothetical protein
MVLIYTIMKRIVLIHGFNNIKVMHNIDLRTCKRGDILISSLGAKLEYICQHPGYIIII